MYNNRQTEDIPYLSQRGIPFLHQQDRRRQDDLKSPQDNTYLPRRGIPFLYQQDRRRQDDHQFPQRAFRSLLPASKAPPVYPGMWPVNTTQQDDDTLGNESSTDQVNPIPVPLSSAGSKPFLAAFRHLGSGGCHNCEEQEELPRHYEDEEEEPPPQTNPPPVMIAKVAKVATSSEDDNCAKKEALASWYSNEDEEEDALDILNWATEGQDDDSPKAQAYRQLAPDTATARVSESGIDDQDTNDDQGEDGEPLKEAMSGEKTTPSLNKSEATEPTKKMPATWEDVAKEWNSKKQSLRRDQDVLRNPEKPNVIDGVEYDLVGNNQKLARQRDRIRQRKGIVDNHVLGGEDHGSHEMVGLIGDSLEDLNDTVKGKEEELEQAGGEEESTKNSVRQMTQPPEIQDTTQPETMSEEEIGQPLWGEFPEDEEEEEGEIGDGEDTTTEMPATSDNPMSSIDDQSESLETSLVTSTTNPEATTTIMVDDSGTLQKESGYPVMRSEGNKNSSSKDVGELMTVGKDKDKNGSKEEFYNDGEEDEGDLLSKDEEDGEEEEEYDFEEEEIEHEDEDDEDYMLSSGQDYFLNSQYPYKDSRHISSNQVLQDSPLRPSRVKHTRRPHKTAVVHRRRNP